MTSIRPGVGAVGRVISSSGESSFKSLAFIGEEGLTEGRKARRERDVNDFLPVQLKIRFCRADIQILEAGALAHERSRHAVPARQITALSPHG
jgi:hypothetical protein